MKISKLVMLLILLSAVSVAFGQSYAFKVLANKGANEVKSADIWQAIKTGASLNASDDLKISDNGYLALVSKDGKPKELKVSGTYKVSDLLEQVKAQGKSVLNKYTDFVMSSNSAEAKKARLSATGAVHRGAPEAINVFLPPNQNAAVFNPFAIINWESKNVGPYVITLKNMWEDELMKTETTGNSIQVNFSDAKFASEQAILVEVRSKSDPNNKSEQHLIKKLSPEEQEKVKKALAEISGDLQEETALNQIILAGFYESNQLFIDAITCYEKAIKLAPDVATYKEQYEEFLLRNKLKSSK